MVPVDPGDLAISLWLDSCPARFEKVFASSTREHLLSREPATRVTILSSAAAAASGRGRKPEAAGVCAKVDAQSHWAILMRTYFHICCLAPLQSTICELVQLVFILHFTLCLLF